MGGHVGGLGEKRNAYRLVVEKPEGRRLLGRPSRRWVANIRMDLVEVGGGDVEWTGLAQGGDRCRAVVNFVLKFLFEAEYIPGPWCAGRIR
jgi:hypothetical protein